MSGETESNVSGWTTDTLHTHMQRQLDGLVVRLDERYGTQQVALETALAGVKATAVVSEKRLDLLNELRGDVPTRAEMKALETLLNDVKARMDRFEGKGSGMQASWAILVGAVGLVVAVISTGVAVYLAVKG